MKSLAIGQPVVVTGKAHVGYGYIPEIQNRRRLEWWTTDPFIGVVVGQVVKQLGKYQGGTSLNWYGQADEDYEGPTLTVTGTVILWRVRQSMRSKEILVRDEDIMALPADVDYKFPVSAPPRPMCLAYHCPLEDEFEREKARLEARKPQLLLTHQHADQLCLPRP